MTDELAIQLQDVGKRYVQLQEQAMLLRSLMPFRTAIRTERWALRGVDLSVARGETVGVVGHNGAGKTTLLRLLAGVSRPSEGRISLTGRVAPLIGIGVGFHQEMSGRENVYVNGMLLGLTKSEVEARFDDIVAFAELDSFIDTPVKFYSSGMLMRLGFSVAIHVDPQILLVDELLAVGDLAFQLRCFDRMRQLNDSGTTIVIVSHSMHAIRLLCQRAVLIQAGHVELDGDIEDVIARHEELLSRVGHIDGIDQTGAEGAAGGASITGRELRGPNGATARLEAGVPMQLAARIRFEAEVESPQVHFTVMGPDGAIAYQMRSVLNRKHRAFRAGEEADLAISFTPHLTGGPFRLLITVTSIDGRRILHRDSRGLVVDAPTAVVDVGFVDLDACFHIDGDPQGLSGLG